MGINISNEQKLAMRIQSRKVTDLFGKEPDKVELNKLSWAELNRLSGEMNKVLNGLSDRMTDDLPEERARQVEDAFNGATQIRDAIETEKDFRTKAGDRSPRAHDGDPRRPMSDGEGVRGVDDGNVPGPHLLEMPSLGLRANQRMADHIPHQSFGRGDFAGITPGAYFRAMFLGAKTDAEHRALVGGTDSAGGYTVPEIVSAQVIDLARAQSVVMAAGARTVPLTSDAVHIAKVATDPAPAWRDEGGSVDESDPTFTRVTFAPKSLGCLVKVSREVLEDSLNIETLLPQLIAKSMGRELDRVALLGSGTAPEPRGVANFSGIQTVAHGASLESYAPLISARTKVKTVNHERVTGYIMHPRDEGILAGLVDTTGQPIAMPSALSGIPMLTTTEIAVDGGVGDDESTIFAGDFSKLMIGIRHGIQIMILRERYMDTGHYGFIAFMRADVQAEYTNAFVKITGVKP